MGKFLIPVWIHMVCSNSEFETIEEAKDAAIENYSREHNCMRYDIALKNIEFIIDKEI